MPARDHALDLIGSMGATSAWLNRLDRLFAVVREAVGRMPASAAKDDALVAIEAFRLEFYGSDDGSDHPDALPISSTPLEDDARTDLLAKATALEQVSVTGIPAGTALLVISYPVGDRFGSEQYDRMTALARQLVDTFQDPKPLVLMNPDNAYDIQALDDEAMLRHGWKRA